MTTDKRNTAVVIALILSLTVGARLLMWLEPAKPQWKANPLLMAERGAGVQEIVIAYVASSAGADERVDAYLHEGGASSLCVVYPDQRPRYWARGTSWDFLVVGSEADELEPRQKAWLLGALGSLVQPTGLERVRVRLSPDSDPELDANLPVQAVDLRELLVRKQIID
jgi:hypothetical protein